MAAAPAESPELAPAAQPAASAPVSAQGRRLLQDFSYEPVAYENGPGLAPAPGPLAAAFSPLSDLEIPDDEGPASPDTDLYTSFKKKKKKHKKKAATGVTLPADNSAPAAQQSVVLGGYTPAGPPPPADTSAVGGYAASQMSKQVGLAAYVPLQCYLIGLQFLWWHLG
jgi:hypothetical protein